MKITFPLLIYVETFSNPIPSNLFNAFILIILFTPTLTPRPNATKTLKAGCKVISVWHATNVDR